MVLFLDDVLSFLQISMVVGEYTHTIQHEAMVVYRIPYTLTSNVVELNERRRGIESMSFNSSSSDQLTSKEVKIRTSTRLRKSSEIISQNATRRILTLS